MTETVQSGPGGGLPGAYTDEPAAVAATVAGFIVWLARQRPPVEQRRRSPTHVERFLRWQRVQPAGGRSEDHYLDELTRDCVRAPEVAEVRTALGLLRRYRDATA